MIAREPLDLRIRTALFIGFGLTLGVWLFAGYHFAQRLRELELQSAAISVRYVRAQELLSPVRAQILLGSVHVRDALLDPDPAAVDDYRRRFEEAYGVIDTRLRQYVPVDDSASGRTSVARLRREIDDFRDTMLKVLDGDSTNWPAEAKTLLQTTLAPRRELVIRVSEELQALNRASFVQQRDAIAELYGVTQRGIWVSFGLALAASFGIAVLSTLYTGRLEQRIRAQRALAAQYAQDLQKLSAKLITAQEEERRSIARELHDEVGQVLTTIKVELSIAQNAIAAAGGRPDILENARTIADGAVHTVRDLSHLLHPALLDDLGLPEAVQWYLRGFGKRHAIRTELDRRGLEARLLPEVETAAYRIVQEALTNVAKHAQASRCRVSLQRLPGTLRIAIEDDGVGFDPAEAEASSPARGGLGLLSIRERATQLRGVVHIDTAPGRGTQLTVELPTERDSTDVPASTAALRDRPISLAPGATRA